MSGLVEQLRWYPAHARDGDPNVCRIPSSYLIEAADEIERLRAVIKQGRLCDPRYCTFGNENEIERLWGELDVEKAMVAFHQKNERVKNDEIEQLRAALQALADGEVTSNIHVRAYARRTLEGK